MRLNIEHVSANNDKIHFKHFLEWGNKENVFQGKSKGNEIPRIAQLPQ